MVVTNYAKKYGKALDQKVKQGTLTNNLVTENVKWLGAKTFQMPTIGTSGYKNHNRGGGFQSGTWDIDDTPYTVTQDRSVEFFVDQMDIDETDEAASVSNITKVFLDENANPEIDAYRFSQLVAGAGVKTTTGVSGTANEVYKQLKADIRKARKFGSNTTFCYVSSDVMSAVEDAREDKVTVVVQNEGTVIETRVTKIDGVSVIEVFDADRFKTEYDFSNGYVPTETAKDINWIIVSKKAVVAAVKHAVVYLFKPGEHTEGDGYLYQNRIYHDIFVKSKNKDGVIVSTGGVTITEPTETVTA